ncbi:MAG: 50S ribosomal protein L10 [Candidatus Magasanikbacteria bacterium RIFCSPHIGHO2_02_FULL_51_14]|uniref:Large ribosomal subunit protein uL10 n=1 Tax=Candidatus Magasanikbacteria bacterium RIFCSPHIGHO2_02_FULL_51_14 TaxID=1798683 RepID=A0A1F6MHF8_9BACT|nr:MAG: 50S ribosomal protein L10 [Candidatus Magasanikbacteria bacterium RIFCSPHIGHO2_02_FULL_51_14]
MAKTREQKEQHIALLADKLKTAKSVVFANFQGLKMSESDELREACRKQNVAYMASKKTLLKRAIEAAGLTIAPEKLESGVAVAFGADEVAPAQALANFGKTHEVMTIYGGILEGAFIDSAKVMELSKLGSKQELLAKLVGTINAPVAGFVNVLAGNLRGLVTVLNAIKEAKA